jgi:hypothetical protein
MKKIYTLIIAAALMFGGCEPKANDNDTKFDTEQPDNSSSYPTLSIDKSYINAAYTAGTYQLWVTTTQAWSAKVSAGDTWCTISPNSSASDHAVTVGVAEQPQRPSASRTATITFTAGELTCTVDITQAGAPPVLTVDETAIKLTHKAGNYTVAITSIATWTATVSAGATWCTVSPATSTRNGKVKINVVENPATITRAATVTIACDTAMRTIAVSQDARPAPPPYAASTITWVVGDQTWSDYIQMPGCASIGWKESDTEPACRTYGGVHNAYEYNWAYVNANAERMCPSPWHIPSGAEFRDLAYMVSPYASYCNTISFDPPWFFSTDIWCSATCSSGKGGIVGEIPHFQNISCSNTNTWGTYCYKKSTPHYVQCVMR